MYANRNTLERKRVTFYFLYYFFFFFNTNSFYKAHREKKQQTKEFKINFRKSWENICWDYYTSKRSYCYIR